MTVLSSRTTADSASAVDASSRIQTQFRLATDGVPVIGSLASRSVSFSRTGVVVGFTTTDNAIGSRVLGAPIPTILSLSRLKVSRVSGADSMILVFVFDKDAYAWEVRVNSTGPFDGNRVAGWVSAGLERVAGGSVEVLATDLLHGTNEVVVYGRSYYGLWSPHPVSG